MNADSECTCEACTALAAVYPTNPAQLAFYRKRLLVRGWAGRTSPVEKAYILAHSTWAQAAAERGINNLRAMRLAHVSNAPDETASAAEVVLADIEGVLA